MSYELKIINFFDMNSDDEVDEVYFREKTLNRNDMIVRYLKSIS